MADTLIGKTLGAYTLIQQIGVGGSGTVYLAQSPEGREVAIKILTIPPGLNPEQGVELRKRFLREAQVMQTLRHPHILPVESVADDEALQVPYMVMPYIANGTLATRIVNGPLALATTTNYISQIAQALDFAHGQNVIHRDIKLANILVDEQDQVYLTDFGIVKLFDAMNTTLTNMNQIIGTPGYMSPEQIKSEAVSPATDVYSLSIVAYELVTGRIPFQSDTMFAMMQKITQDPPPLPRQLRPDLPPAAEAVLLRGLAKDPKQRFPRAGDFAAALAQGIQGVWPAGLQPLPTPPTIAAPVIPPTMSAPPLVLPSHNYPYPTNSFTAPAPSVSYPPPLVKVRPNRGWLVGIIAALLLVMVAAVVFSVLIHRGENGSSTYGYITPPTVATDTMVPATASPTTAAPTATATIVPLTATIVPLTAAQIWNNARTLSYTNFGGQVLIVDKDASGNETSRQTGKEDDNFNPNLTYIYESSPGISYEQIFDFDNNTQYTRCNSSGSWYQKTYTSGGSTGSVWLYLRQAVTSPTLIGTDTIDGTPSYHLRQTGTGNPYDIWVATQTYQLTQYQDSTNFVNGSTTGTIVNTTTMTYWNENGQVVKVPQPSDTVPGSASC